ncbi:TMEM43 family protein [Kiritimatiellaeota bacterium B1221]|nr:TMEM43 family protein [Kiritimatiellaeota bacterium B1221]
MASTVTTQSWGSRLMDSLKNIVFGFVIFGLGIWLLWWNEHRAVRDYKEINDVRNNVVSVSSDSISPMNEGLPVHVSGKARTPDVLKDKFFEVEANAIRLRRKVEMYQWKERIESSTKKKVGGGTETTETPVYEKIWSEQLISSQNFRETGHENPSVMQPEGWTDVAETVTLDSFTLSQDAVQKLRAYEPYPVHRATLPEGARLEDSVIKYGSNGAAPEIGDKRVTFQIVPQGPVSIIAAQMGSELVPWVSSRGQGYIRVQTGSHTAEEMLTQAESEIRMLTWLLRAGGWLLMSFGMITVLMPLSVLGDVLPFLGSLIGGGIKFFSFLTCAVLALLIIGIAWIASRPLVGIPVVAAGGGLVVWLVLRAKKKKEVVA